MGAQNSLRACNACSQSAAFDPGTMRRAPSGVGTTPGLVCGQLALCLARRRGALAGLWAARAAAGQWQAAVVAPTLLVQNAGG